MTDRKTEDAVRLADRHFITQCRNLEKGLSGVVSVLGDPIVERHRDNPVLHGFECSADVSHTGGSGGLSPMNQVAGQI
jgi:hypothetical protein